MDDIDIGYKYGEKTVIGIEYRDVLMWKCVNHLKYVTYRCSCGNIKSIYVAAFKNGKSCGCLRGSPKKFYFLNKETTRDNKLYSVLNEMKARCYRKRNISYKYYGARGITICDEWLNKETGFINFYNWAMANGYKEGLTIDRIDVNGNYCPENCRWVTVLQQNRNKRNNKHVVYQGVYYNTVSELAEQLNLDAKFTNNRLCSNIPLTKPKRKVIKIIYKNNIYKVSELSNILNISRQAVYNRLKNNTLTEYNY